MAARAADLDPDNTNILVCGGGGVALETVKLLKDMGSWVWMMQRHDERKSQIEKWFAVWVKGDAMDKASVDKVFQQIEGGQASAARMGPTVRPPLLDWRLVPLLPAADARSPSLRRWTRWCARSAAPSRTTGSTRRATST